MQIDVIEIIEQEDGSCLVTLEADKEAKELLMELGFNQLLKTYRWKEGMPDENEV
jgi:hypothetical protein